MKHLPYIFLLGVAITLAACRDEDKIRIPENLTAVNMRLIIEPDNAVIRYDSVATDQFAFNAYSENTDLALVEFTATFRGVTEVIRTFTQADFNDGVERVVLTAADFATAFDEPGFTNGTQGGNFTIRPRVTLNDGRVYPAWVHLSPTDSVLNVATSVIGSSAGFGAFTLQLLTSITCAPADISGTYLVVSASGTSTDGCCPNATTVSGNTVTITQASATTFTMSDFSGGLYFEWYDVYGITSPNDSPGTLSYNCSEVNFTNTIEPFETPVAGGGPVDFDAGTITYTWSNGYGDTGTVVLQKQ